MAARVERQKRNAAPEKQEPPATFLSRVATFYLATLLVLAPLKFGTAITAGGVAVFPLSVLEWLVGPWPSFMAPAAAGVGLLLVVLSARPEAYPKLRSFKLLWLPAVLLVVVCAPGFWRTTEWDVAVMFIWHVLGVVCLVLAVFLHLASYPQCRTVLLGAIAGATLWVAWKGWQQILFEFDMTRDAAIYEFAATGREMPPALERKLVENRAFSTFVYPNSFAAHLILTIPICLLCVWRWASRIDPVRLSQGILSSVALVLLVVALVLTKSRAGLLAFFGGGLVTVAIAAFHYWRTLRRRSALRWALAAIVATQFICLVALCYTRRDNFSSAAARLGYYHAGLKMFAKQPLSGVGLGEFFPHYMQIKPPGAEETRIPHNLFLYYLSQCGILGGLGALCFLAQPLFLWAAIVRRRRAEWDKAVWVAVSFGCVSWALHSLTDFDLQIPGTLMTFVVLPVLAMNFGDRDGAPSGGVLVVLKTALAATALLAVAGLWRVPGERHYQRLTLARWNGSPAEFLQRVATPAGRWLPLSPYPWGVVGKEALTQEKYEIAETAFLEASRRTPHRAAYHAYLARIDLAKGRAAEAREHLKHVLTWYPHKPAYLELQRQVDEQLQGGQPQ